MRLKATASSSNSSPVWISARRRDVAAADGVADVAQVPQRLDDHVADDGVGGDHRQEDGDDGRGHRIARFRLIACCVGPLGMVT